MLNGKVISGITDKTPQKLLLDAGAYFKNYVVGTDTFATAVTAGKLLGATKGGGSFSAAPKIRPLEMDGMRGPTKGLEVVDEWEVMIGAKLVEVSADTIVAALAIADKAVGAAGPPDYSKYEIITGRTNIKDTDYLENITWVGTLSGSLEPVIIQVLNALNMKGLELSMEDKSEGVIETEFTGHFDFTKPDEVPFKIFYPKVTA